MAYHFCTITTGSYLYKTYALYESLRRISAEVCLHVLITDEAPAPSVNSRDMFFYNKAQLANDETGSAIIEKYRRSPDKLRWSLKPVFLRYLLLNNKLEKVIYCDNDIAFFNDYTFLFDLLDQHPVLLTPHRYPRDPFNNQKWLEVNFTNGLYNAGFVAVNQHAAGILLWWASCCLYRCERNPWRGLFDDQKYLDLVPVIEPKTLVLQHEGCNIADWNRDICRRTLVEHEVMINERYPVVFIHFNTTTLRTIKEGNDPLLMPFFEQYGEMLKTFKHDFNWESIIRGVTLKEKWEHKIWRLLDYLNKRTYQRPKRHKNS
jgi:hypothetical protein